MTRRNARMSDWLAVNDLSRSSRRLSTHVKRQREGGADSQHTPSVRDISAGETP
jgi:hypothetical protein